MDLVKVTDATIFKFQRPEKKWREKGYGDVTFVLKGEDLMVTLGKQSFFVKGTLKPKGPNAVVMRVWGIEACSDEPDMILAVRFAKEGDLERLAVMLSDKKLDKRKTRTSRMSRRRSQKSPLPPWFASMEKSKRNSIQNLIKSAKPMYLKDGTIRTQLAQMYDLSPGQIQWVIDFFLSWRHVGKMRQTHKRAVSCSLNSVSSFPSLSFHNSGGAMRHVSQMNAASPGNNSSNQVGNGRHIRLPPNLVFPSRRNHRSRGNLSDFSAQVIRSPGMSSSFHRPADIEANPNKQICMSPELNNANNPHILRTRSGFENNEKLRGTPKIDHGQFNQQNVSHLMPIDENLNPSNSNGGSSSNQVRTPNETIQEDSNLPLSPLTEENLLLYNRLKPPLKGDYRSIVSTWLQKSIP